MTTRRRRPEPLAPWRGRKGLFGRSAIRVSVEGSERGIDPDGATERAVEGAPPGRPLEAGQAAAGVRPAAGRARAGDQLPGLRDEPDELRLRCLAPAADAASFLVTRRQVRPPAPPRAPRQPLPPRRRRPRLPPGPRRARSPQPAPPRRPAPAPCPEAPGAPA